MKTQDARTGNSISLPWVTAGSQGPEGIRCPPLISYFPGEGPGGRLALTPGATSGGRTLSPPEDCEQSYQHFQGPLSREMVPRDQMDHQAFWQLSNPQRPQLLKYHSVNKRHIPVLCTELALIDQDNWPLCVVHWIWRTEYIPGINNDHCLGSTTLNKSLDFSMPRPLLTLREPQLSWQDT